MFADRFGHLCLGVFHGQVVFDSWWYSHHRRVVHRGGELLPFRNVGLCGCRPVLFRKAGYRHGLRARLRRQERRGHRCGHASIASRWNFHPGYLDWYLAENGL